uniref:F-box domain-containing protein n=1 Tax=Leptobrachium leishanense TaxID=445787 RepID=A0A8C5R6F2_9ANUR
MKETGFSLKAATNLSCRNQVSGVPQCLTCETCVLIAKLGVTKEWFPRAGEFSQRKFVLGIIRRLGGLDLLLLIQNVLQPVLGKDFTYSRSRINPSLPEDSSTTGSDRALDQHLWQQFVTETWQWFKGRSHWTKQNYTLRLLKVCKAHLLHSVANLIHVLVIQEMQSALSRKDTPGSHDERLRVMELMDQYGLKDTEGSSLPHTIDDPCLMVVPTSFKATSGVRKYKDFIQGLPLHLSQMILGFLDRKSLSRCACVSRHWCYMVKDVLEDLEAKRLIQNQAMILRGTSSRGVNVSYAKMQQVPVPKIGEDGNAVAREEKIFYVDAKPGESLEAAYIENETEKVVMEERNVFCGPYNVLILAGQRWDLRTGVCLKIYLGHMKTITCLDVWENMLVSGAKDRQVKVWNITSGKCLRTFKHKDAVTEVKIKDQYVVSGCEKGLVKIWHLESASLIKTLSGHDGPVKSLVFDQWHLLSGGADGIAIAWSMMGSFVKRLMTFRHPMEVTSLALQYLRVITGCADGKIRVFNFLNGECLREMIVHSRADPVLSLCVRDNRMVINVLSGILIFTFEDVLWDYSQDSSVRVAVPKERHKFRLAPVKSQPYSYVRAERMRHIGSSNKKLYQWNGEPETDKSRLSHHARSLSARSIKRAQDLHLESLKPTTWTDIKNFHRSFAYIDLQPEFRKKSPFASRCQTSPDVPSRASTAPEWITKDDSDGESGYSSHGCRSALSRSQDATLKRMKRRGPHSPIRPDQILLKVSTIQNRQKSEELGLNFKYNENIQDPRGSPKSHVHHKRECLHSHSSGRHRTGPSISSSADKYTPETPAEIRSSAITQVLFYPTSYHANEEKKRISGNRRCVSAVESGIQRLGMYTSYDAVQPLRMMIGQNKTVEGQKKQPAPTSAVDPFRKKSGFQLLTVEQLEEYEAKAKSQYEKTEAQEKASKAMAHKRERLTKIKGERIEIDSNEGKIAAPELGLDWINHSRGKCHHQKSMSDVYSPRNSFRLYLL